MKKNCSLTNSHLKNFSDSNKTCKRVEGPFLMKLRSLPNGMEGFIYDSKGHFYQPKVTENA